MHIAVYFYDFFLKYRDKQGAPKKICSISKFYFFKNDQDIAKVVTTVDRLTQKAYSAPDQSTSSVRLFL